MIIIRAHRVGHYLRTDLSRDTTIITTTIIKITTTKQSYKFQNNNNNNSNNNNNKGKLANAFGKLATELFSDSQSGNNNPRNGLDSELTGTACVNPISFHKEVIIVIIMILIVNLLLLF